MGGNQKRNRYTSNLKQVIGEKEYYKNLAQEQMRKPDRRNTAAQRKDEFKRLTISKSACSIEHPFLFVSIYI